MSKAEEKFKAIESRKRGKSYSEILKEVSVARSTLSIWLRDIKLTKQQLAELKGRQKSRYDGAKANQRKRIIKTKKIIGEAQRESKQLIRNSLFLAGLMLYWAEGTKSGEIVNFSNSDPVMIKLMMRWFRKICQVPEQKFRIQLHIHNLHCRKDVKEHWSKVTRIPQNQFHKIQVKPTSLRQRKKVLYEGTCSIRISNKDLFRKIVGWRLGVLKQIGFSEKYIIK